MEQGELEECVTWLYAEAGRDRDDVTTPRRLARDLGVLVVEVPNLPELGHVSFEGATPIISIRKGLAAPQRQHTIGHELGHVAFRSLGIRAESDEAERGCDYVGAGVMMPRRTFVRWATGRELDFEQLAFDFGATQTSTAFRVGELLDVPIVVVTPQLVRARGPVQIDEARARELARTGGPGLARIRLTDARNRVVIVGEETG